MFSEFDDSDPIAFATGETMEDIASEFESQELDFDGYFDLNRITIIEGDIVGIRRQSAFIIVR